jgi:cytochrome c553
MQPGMACKACHGPPTNARTGANFKFMGTLFPSLHEANFCRALPPVGAVVEILNLDGGVAVTMTPNAVGNFFSTTTGNAVPSPYLAQVRIGTRILKMQSSQMNGDCNSCHTAAGANGAAGRVTSPP